MAYEFDVRYLMTACDAYIRQSIATLDRVHLLELIRTLAHIDKHSSLMRLLTERLGALHRRELVELSFDRVPGDVVANIFEHKLQLRHEKPCIVM